MTDDQIRNLVIGQAGAWTGDGAALAAAAPAVLARYAEFRAALAAAVTAQPEQTAGRR